jgi:hypothetical protein
LLAFVEVATDRSAKDGMIVTEAIDDGVERKPALRVEAVATSEETAADVDKPCCVTCVDEDVDNPCCITCVKELDEGACDDEGEMFELLLLVVVTRAPEIDGWILLLDDKVPDEEADEDMLMLLDDVDAKFEFAEVAVGTLVLRMTTESDGLNK